MENSIEVEALFQTTVDNIVLIFLYYFLGIAITKRISEDISLTD